MIEEANILCVDIFLYHRGKPIKHRRRQCIICWEYFVLDLIHVCMIPSRNCVRKLGVIQRSFLFGRNQCFSIKLKSDEFPCQVWRLVFKFIFYDFWTFPSQLSFLGMAHPRARNWCIALPPWSSVLFRDTCGSHQLFHWCSYHVHEPQATSTDCVLIRGKPTIFFWEILEW